MHDCQMHGSQHCKLELAYYNQCAAVALGTSMHFATGSATREIAESHALTMCNKESSNCKIVYSARSPPVRVQ